MARALAGDASTRRGEKESNAENLSSGNTRPQLSCPAALPVRSASVQRSDSVMRRIIPGLAIVFILVLALFRAGELVDIPNGHREVRPDHAQPDGVRCRNQPECR